MACVLSGCAGAPSTGWSARDLMSPSPNAEEYADFLAARYAGMVGDPASAAVYYRRAFEREPDDSDLLEAAVFATLISGEAERAAALAIGAGKSTAEGSPSAQLVLVVDAAANGQRRKALARLKSANLGAVNADLSTFLAAWLQAPDDLAGALARLDQPDGRRMLIGEQHYMQAFILLAAKRDKDARAAFETASRYPVSLPAFLVAERARLFASLGEVDAARDDVAAFVGASAPTAETDTVLAEIASGKSITPLRLNAREGIAVAIWLASAGALTRGNPEMATLRNSLALYADPDFAPARLQLSDALRSQNRFAAATDVLTPVPADSPWYADAQLRLARLLGTRADIAGAQAAASNAITASRRRDIVLGVADLDRDWKRYAEAEGLYDEVIATDEARGAEDWRALFARATAREQRGDWASAEGDLVRALELAPDRPEVQNFLGYGWVNRGERVQEGLALIRLAVAAHPDHGYMIDSLGWAYFQLGDFDRAVEYLERAAELTPDDPEILTHLGDAYWRLDRRLEATFEWRRALAQGPDAAHTASLKARLDAGLPDAGTASLAKNARADAPQGRP
jgi:tetratricopeptide (TPR) repeat protein